MPTAHARILAVAATALCCSTLAHATGTNSLVKLRMAQVTVTVTEHLSHATGLAAFVPTNATGPCLLTLAESNFAIPGTTVFCGIREIDGVSGVFIHVFLPEEPPPDALWLVNIYQVGARRYGAAVPCNGSC